MADCPIDKRRAAIPLEGTVETFQIPSLVIKNKGDSVTDMMLRLTRAKRRVVIRLTGGCGKMSAEDADGLYALYRDALAGFDGAMLFGGTRMLLRDDPSVVVPGITEIPWFCRDVCPDMITLGVIPRTSLIGLCDYGMLINDEPDTPYITIAHPRQHLGLIVQLSADKPEVWDAEWQECVRMTELLRESAGWTSVLICYNGGSVTERELVATATRGWPVILVDGSGRKTEEYARNEAFLAEHPNVRVCDRDARSLRDLLIFFGAHPPEKLRLLKEA